jgi:hypothetical protein
LGVDEELGLSGERKGGRQHPDGPLHFLMISIR